MGTLAIITHIVLNDMASCRDSPLTAPQPYPIRTSTRPKGENHRRIRQVVAL